MNDITPTLNAFDSGDPQGSAELTIYFAPSRLARLERTVRRLEGGKKNEGSETGLSRLKQRFTG